jgi:hypothetical protein
VTCKSCYPIKRFFCIFACKDTNDSFCRVDEVLKAEAESYKAIQLSAWAVIFFILSVMASCEMSQPIPRAAKWNINPELRFRANQQIKEVP